MLFVPHAAPGTGSYSPLLALGWTLNYEVWFYLCFAALAGLSARGRVATITAVFVALALVGAIWHPQSPVASFYTGYAPLAFCVGCWLGLLSIKGRLASLPARVEGVATLVGALALVGAVIVASSGPQWAFLGFSVLAGALVFLALRFETRLPRVPTLLVIGDASYAAYLIHMFVVGLVVALVAKVLPATETPVVVGIVALCLVLAISAALVVHYAVEVPILRLLHSVLVSRRKQAPA
jgi:exopolysaccharide production protein ExoZ